MACRIDRTWKGDPIPETDIGLVEIEFDQTGARIEVSAPFHGDPPPPAPPGPTEGLWNYEVVEVFLLGSSGYIEIELGPHGHYLVLELEAPRRARRRRVPIEYEVTNRTKTRWQGSAQVPMDLLPSGLDRWNAYRIHGSGPRRRYLAALPVPGERPDFHRLDCFGMIVVE